MAKDFDQTDVQATPLGFKLVKGEKLSRHSGLGIGGAADYYCEPQTIDELKKVLDFCQARKISYRVIGGGWNTFFADTGFRGCILSMVSFEKDFFEVRGKEVKASASIRTSSFVRKCNEHGLSGMEFLSFIPGTIGGTLAMNAGCINYSTNQYDEVSQFVQTVDVLEKGEFQTFGREEIDFQYRYSSLRDSIILFGTFSLKQHKIKNFKQELQLNYRERAKKIPMNRPTLGSMFKNPADSPYSAGKLIEEAGLKGLQEGGIVVSSQHANVFENLEEGTAEDVWNLIRRVQSAVKKKYNIELELEIEYID